MSEWNRKRRVMRRYDQSAKVYDSQYFDEQEAKIRIAISNLTILRNSMVLDAGCGTGLLFEHVVRKARLIIGADISRGILREAKRKTKALGNLALVLADADNMPFYDQIFDVVFAITLLQNMPNPLATINEVKRISKSNGTIVATGLKKAFTKEEFVEVLKQAYLKVEILKPDEHMREYITVCTQIPANHH
ncbi:MAG: methyltransferase domain-containing protein [Candidatus Bathyarchaeota archaeon]|nr:methyltransferase domain-containing protein [Candidatus Bathyarchaeota archaeon]